MILPNHGLLEAHAQLDAILAMLPDEELRATISERFKVSSVATFCYLLSATTELIPSLHI